MIEEQAPDDSTEEPQQERFVAEVYLEALVGETALDMRVEFDPPIPYTHKIKTGIKVTSDKPTRIIGRQGMGDVVYFGSPLSELRAKGG